MLAKSEKRGHSMSGAMSGKWLQTFMARRSFLARLGTNAGLLGAAGIRAPLAAAQAAPDAPWRPARHPQDDWFDQIPGKHRFVFDTTTPDGMASALRFAANYFIANENAYGLKDSDLAVVIIARHKSTPFAYADAIWAKYGKQISELAEFTDPKTKQPPKINVYAARADGSAQSRPLETLIAKGVQFAVCQMASRAVAETIAKATGGDADAILKEIGANLIPNSRLVPAGIVTVNRAQERGYSFVFGG
jgi:intracellular sulfur oxidation DsrE/DsrF family protein